MTRSASGAAAPACPAGKGGLSPLALALLLVAQVLAAQFLAAGAVRSETLPGAPADPRAESATDPALSGPAFDALTRGLTMDTYDAETGLYGIESFLSGRRVIWRDAERCVHGSWRESGNQICFDYEGSERPVCWTYHQRDGWIEGFFEGRRETVPIRLVPGEGPLACEGFLGA